MNESQYNFYVKSKFPVPVAYEKFKDDWKKAVKRLKESGKDLSKIYITEGKGK